MQLKDETVNVYGLHLTEAISGTNLNAVLKGDDMHAVGCHPTAGDHCYGMVHIVWSPLLCRGDYLAAATSVTP
jgi:hypothetical protein